jgi:hypothetical protein
VNQGPTGSSQLRWQRATRSTLQRVHKCIEVGGGIFENLLWDVDQPRFCPLQIISNTTVSTCMHVMLFITQLLFVLAGRSISSFYHTLGNRSKSDPRSHELFFLRIKHTITSQNIADSSWIILFTAIPPDDGQQTSLKHVEFNWWNKVRISSASSCFHHTHKSICTVNETQNFVATEHNKVLLHLTSSHTAKLAVTVCNHQYTKGSTQNSLTHITTWQQATCGLSTTGVFNAWPAGHM